MDTTIVKRRKNPWYLGDSIWISFGSSKDSRAGYDGANDEWTVQTKDAGGAQTDRIQVTGNQDVTQVQLYNDDPGAAGVQLDVHHESASPAASDSLFDLRVYGEDDGGAKTQYSGLTAVLVDPANGSEDGRWDWKVMAAGTLTTVAQLGAGGFRLLDGSATVNALELGTGGDSRVYYDGTDTFWDLQAVGAGKLMIAGAGSFPSPDSAVHIWAGSAGAVSAAGSAVLTIEDDNTVLVQLLYPSANAGGLYFGDESANDAGFLLFRHTGDRFEFGVSGTNMLYYSSGSFAFQQATDISTPASTDLGLLPGAGGNVKFGAHSAIGAETVTGFITIKDAGGTSRKLAVVS